MFSRHATLLGHFRKASATNVRAGSNKLSFARYSDNDCVSSKFAEILLRILQKFEHRRELMLYTV